MKAQTFKIVGDTRFFPQMQEDLTKLGYKWSDYEASAREAIHNNNTYPNNKESFLVLNIYPLNLTDFENVFTLPEDYNKAVEFAKEQLNDKYWREEFKLGDYVATGKNYHPGSQVAKIIGKYTTKDEYALKYKNGDEENWGNNLRKATPEEIEEYNRKEYKVGDIIVTNQNVTFELISGRVNSSVGWIYSGKRKDEWIIPIIENTFRSATPQEIEEFNRIDWKVGEIADYCNGNIVKVIYVGSSRVQVQYKNGSKTYNDLTSIKKPTPEQIEEFNKPVYKAGDYVVGSRTGAIAKLLQGGDEGIKDIELSDGTRGVWNVTSKSVRLATPEEIKKANELKDGDIVVGIEEGYTLKVGQLGKLKLRNFRNSGAKWEIVDKEDKVILWAWASEYNTYCRKATKEEIAEFNRPVWKEGDIIYLIDNGRSYGKITNQVVKLDAIHSDGSINFKSKNKRVLLDGGKNFKARLATPEEIKEFNEPEELKDGDIVVGKDYVKGELGRIKIVAFSCFQVFNKKGKEIFKSSFPSTPDKFWEKANEEQIKKFNEPEYVEMTVGSRNAKIKIYKNTVSSSESKLIDIARLKVYYKDYSTLAKDYTVGHYYANIDYTVPFIRIGCVTENNLVSLNEIKAVLEAAERL